MIKTLPALGAEIKTIADNVAEMNIEISTSRAEINRLKYECLQLEIDIEHLKEQIVGEEEIEQLQL